MPVVKVRMEIKANMVKHVFSPSWFVCVQEHADGS